MYYKIEYTIKGVSFDCIVKALDTHWICVHYYNANRWFIRKEPLSEETLKRGIQCTKEEFNELIQKCYQQTN